MSLKQRVKKLEGGTRRTEVIVIRDSLSEAEEDAFVREHLRAKGLSPDTAVIRITEAEAKL